MFDARRSFRTEALRTTDYCCYRYRYCYCYVPARVEVGIDVSKIKQPIEILKSHTREQLQKHYIHIQTPPQSTGKGYTQPTYYSVCPFEISFLYPSNVYHFPRVSTPSSKAFALTWYRALTWYSLRVSPPEHTFRALEKAVGTRGRGSLAAR